MSAGLKRLGRLFKGDTSHAKSRRSLFGGANSSNRKCPVANRPARRRYNRRVEVSLDRDRLEVVARTHGVRLLLQFGSTVSGHTHARSDLDLAVLLDRVPQSFQEYAELRSDIEALVPALEVDLVVINRADPLLLKKILDRCMLLYGSPRALHELKMYAFSRYQDYRRYLVLEGEYLARKLQPNA